MWEDSDDVTKGPAPDDVVQDRNEEDVDKSSPADVGQDQAKDYVTTGGSASSTTIMKTDHWTHYNIDVLL